ncbi:MAG: glycosyltransferase [Methanomassiliicoccales archaeon]
MPFGVTEENGMRDDGERAVKAVSALSSIFPDGQIEFLGTGSESVLMVRDGTVYKYFDGWNKDYDNLLEQLVHRFQGCKHLIDIDGLLSIDGVPVIYYAYAPSIPYDGCREDEVVEFLRECWRTQIVCWDVKPSNFRIFEDGVKLVDYGWDIKPFNHKDFLFMCQRAYLMLNYRPGSDFKALARRGLFDWNLPELNGFAKFFNKVLDGLEKEPLNGWNPLRLVDRSKLTHWLIEKVDPERRKKCILFTDVLFENHDYGIPDNWTVSHLMDDMPGHDALVVDCANSHSGLDLISQIKEKLDVVLVSKHPVRELYLLSANPFHSKQLNSGIIRELKTILWNRGLHLQGALQAPSDFDSEGHPFSEHLLLIVKNCRRTEASVSLLIKSCYQDARTLDGMVRHIVHQCEGPDLFTEKVVVVDTKENDFLRQFSAPDREEALRTLEHLVEEGLIDEYLLSPIEPEEIKEINRRWFGLDCLETHSVKGVPVTPQLFGFERVKGDYVLQVDSDAMICRRDRSHSYLSDMIEALDRDPKVLSVGFNIAHDPSENFVEYSSPGNGEYVPEVRFCLFNKERLLNQRPYPNHLVCGKLGLTWYRSIQAYQREKDLRSLRGGDPRSFYVHPQNDRKGNVTEWMDILSTVESGYVPNEQYGKFDLTSTYERWSIPKRKESYVFVICGRNVEPRKFERCWRSLLDQRFTRWGAIIVDDASNNGLAEFIEMRTADQADKITFIRNTERRGVLFNVHRAIKNYCTDPNTVIVILDMDDQLLGPNVLGSVHDQYMSGADMTIGTPWKWGKGILPYEPDFENVRMPRFGDVWMHLRTFRKFLFDRIPTSYFKKDGEWIDKFTELTYMVPMVQMALDPRHVPDPNYLWQPTQIRNEEHRIRNMETKEHVANRPAVEKREPEVGVSPPGEILKQIGPHRNLIFIRHSEKDKSKGRWDLETHPDVPLTEQGVRDATIWGRNLPRIDLVLTSPTLRTVQTGKAILGTDDQDERLVVIPYVRFIKDEQRAAWNEMKRTIGWIPLIEKWVSGDVPKEIVNPHKELVEEMLDKIFNEIDQRSAKNIVVVTHDHIITALSAYFFSETAFNVRYLDGFCLCYLKDPRESLEMNRRKETIGLESDYDPKYAVEP